MHRAGGWVALAGSLVACGGGYSKLNVDKVQSVAVVAAPDGDRFCAYKPVPLRAVVTYRDGKHAQTRVADEAADGRLRTTEFQWSTSQGAIDQDAILSLPDDVLAWFDAPIRVTSRVSAKPALQGEGTLRPRFDCGGTLDVTGERGARGGEGENGGPGAPGLTVDIALAYIDSKTGGRLVLMRVQPGQNPVEHYVIAANGSQGQVVVDATGGGGGRGGQGVDGADTPGSCSGSADGSAMPPPPPPPPGAPDGRGSDGGHGGDGGRGGVVTVRYDARIPELASLVRVVVDGGKPGDGGAAGHGGLIGGACGTARGPTGTDGTAGQAGGAGEAHTEPGNVTDLFADEIAHGLPVVTADGTTGGAP